MSNRLLRSRSDVIIGGVCAGLGNYLGIDPILVRIFFVLLAVVGGSGVLVYLILWIIMPREDQVTPQGDLGDRMTGIRDEMVASASHPNQKAGLYIGIGLVALGLFYLLRTLDVSWLFWLKDKYMLPALLVIGGAALLIRAIRERQQ